MKVLGVVTHQTTVLNNNIPLLALEMLLTLPISSYLFILLSSNNRVKSRNIERCLATTCMV